MDTNTRAGAGAEGMESEFRLRRLRFGHHFLVGDPALWVETIRGQLVLRGKVQRHDLRQRVAPDLGVAMQSVGLRVDRDALWDVVTCELGATLRYHSR